MKKKTLFLLLLSTIAWCSVFHELAHALVGTYFGWQVTGIFFTPFVRWVEFAPLQHTPSLSERLAVYSCGGLVDFAIFGFIWLKMIDSGKHFYLSEKVMVGIQTVWSLVYAVIETVCLGILAW